LCESCYDKREAEVEKLRAALAHVCLDSINARVIADAALGNCTTRQKHGYIKAAEGR